MKPHELEREFQKELDIILPEGEYILPSTIPQSPAS